jgi:hypothetical protein
MTYGITAQARLLCAVLIAIPGGLSFAQSPASANARPPVKWQSPARWHQLFNKETDGSLILDDGGVEFRSPKFSHRWPYEEISTFELSNTPAPTAGRKKRPHDVQELIVTGYENRHWHEPGERRFRFTLAEAMPPAIAGELTGRVGRPAINGNSDSNQPVIAELPAHRRERFGGSNGQLRFRTGGIDYVTADGRDGRSWRWSDIQTLANPDPYELRVTAYREIVEFDLKKPLSRELFGKLWDRLYASDLNVASPQGVNHQ